MTLRDMMARHAAGPLVRLDHHGEEVVLISDDGDTETTIRAVVDRMDAEPSATSTRFRRLSAMVFLPVQPMPSTPVPGDKLRMAMRLNGPVLEPRITRLVTQDEGGVLVEVQT